MKKHGITIVAYGSALLLAAGTAGAQQGATGGAAGTGTQHGAQAGSAAMKGQAAGAQDPNAHYLSMHRAAGTIRSIDKQKGNVEIDLTNGERVKLNLPQPVLQAFDDGDKVVVATQLAIAGGDPARGANAGATAAGRGESDMGAGSAGGATRDGGTSGGTMSGGSAQGQGAGSADTTR